MMTRPVLFGHDERSSDRSNEPAARREAVGTTGKFKAAEGSAPPPRGSAPAAAWRERRVSGIELPMAFLRGRE